MEFFSPTQENKRLGLFSPLQFWTFSVLCSRMENLQSEPAVGVRSALLKRIKGLQMAQRLGLFSPLQYWTLLVLQNRMEWICSLEFFSPAEENKRSAMALQFGLFQSYAVEWRACRVNLQLEFVQPCRRELKACRWLSDLDFLSVLCSIGLFWSYEIE